MITILIVFLSHGAFCDSDVEEQTVTVTNFHDYSIHMKKAGDKLNIITPAKTLVFFSSSDGYNVIGIAQGLMPNPKRRIYYTYKSGYVIVYSTIDNLDFHFHSLVLDKIDYPIDNIFVSSSPSEEFKIKTANSYSNTNATFGESNLLWLLGKSKSSCRVGTTVYNYYLDAMHNYKNFYVYPTYYALPFSDPSSQSQIEFNRISLGLKEYTNIESYSKIFYIEKVDMLAPNIDSHLTIFCRPTELSNDYYSDYRSYFKNPSSFLENQYIDRGQYHYQLPQSYSLIGDGEIFELDFSIVNQIKTDQVRKLFIFPKLSKMTTSFIFNDTVLLLFRNSF